MAPAAHPARYRSVLVEVARPESGAAALAYAAGLTGASRPRYTALAVAKSSRPAVWAFGLPPAATIVTHSAVSVDLKSAELVLEQAIADASLDLAVHRHVSASKRVVALRDRACCANHDLIVLEPAKGARQLVQRHISWRLRRSLHVDVVITPNPARRAMQGRGTTTRNVGQRLLGVGR